MSEADMIARVERDRQQQRIEALLEALKAIAEDGSGARPNDSVSGDDVRHYLNKSEAWYGGHEEGVVVGRWLSGKEAQDALDEWERRA